MRKSLIAAGLLLALCGSARAGDVEFLSGGCGSANLATNANPYLTVDSAGRNCIGLYYTYSNITGDATNVVKASAGVLHTITINNPGASETVTIYDGTAATGTKIGTITLPASGGVPSTLTYDVAFSTNLTIVTGVATGDITVSYK